VKIIQIIVTFLALLLVFLSLSLDPESHIFRCRMLRWLPVIRFYFKVSKGIYKLKVGGLSTFEDLTNQNTQATSKTLTSEDEGFKQLVSLLRYIGSIQEPRKVEKLIMRDFTNIHSGTYDQILKMVIDGAEELVCRPSSNQALSINELMELNKKRASRKLTYITAFVAVLIFVLTIIYVIWVPTGN